MYRPGGDYDDRGDELDEQQRLQEELELASRMQPGSRFATAATRALVFPPGAARARDPSQMATGNAAAAAAARRNMDAAAFMSMLGGNDADGAASRAHALSSSPYYQRQPTHYARPYLPPQSAYGALTSDAGLYGRRPGYGYPPPGGNGASPQDPRYHPYGMPNQPGARDFGAFYSRQAQELSQAAILDRAYGVQKRAQPVENDTPTMMSVASAVKPQHQPSTLPASYLPKGQSPKSPAPAPSPAAKSPKEPRAGRGGGRGRGGRGRGGRGSGGRGGRGASEKPKGPTPKQVAALEKAKKEKEAAAAIIEQRPWFAGCVPLGLPEDKYWLSELQVYLRSNFAEAFGATESDIAAPMHGRNKPIALGQVGIRCMHCRDDPPSERGQQATSYPSLISGIYNSVQQMLRLHFDCCLAMPPEVRKKIESLKVSSSARGGRKQYWIDSAKRLGLIDTPHGIHFGRDPYGPLPPLEGPSVSTREAAAKEKDVTLGTGSAEKAPEENDTEDEAPEAIITCPPISLGLPPEEMYPLVLPEDMPLISDYLYLTLEQMQPAKLMEADKVGCYKGRKVGFRGLACMHCVGQAGCGRYFPASEASLSQTTTSQTIMNHVRNCRRCPIEIRENLELMKRARMGPDGKRADKPKHGGRKVFFRRLWCRIQGLPMDDETATKKRGPSTYTRRKGIYGKKGKRRSSSPTEDSSTDSDDSDDEENEDGSVHNDSLEDEETETEEEDSNSSEDDDVSDDGKPKAVAKSSKSKLKAYSLKKSPNKPLSKWHEGCVRLTKSDDPHWLSEMQCYVRSDLVEVFSLKKKEALDGYAGRKEPGVGQVGIRCAFCKSLAKVERPGGCVYFPDSLSSIHSKVGDLIRLHFPSCPAMPDDVKETFKSLRGFGAKADGDAQQYWIDAARDIGLNDIPPTPSGWGITFRRDPLQPSPADELDRENAGAATFSFNKTMLIRAEDRGMCTDHVMLLLRQVNACRFKKSDRRGGPGARGRDRVIGFPGLCCKHCTLKNNFGRYFPVSAKNLTDNTTNSLQGHVVSCSRCPEPIKASLAYLMHRSVLQKAELSGSWKKTFFKRVWDRLHIERAWNSTDGGLRQHGDASVSSGANNDEMESKTGSQISGSDSEEEDLGDDMADIIKAAAVWLCEQENSTDPSSRTRTTSRGRVLPSKRTVPFSPPRGRGRGGALTSKRRRVIAV